MIMADTSVWVDHLRKGDATLLELLGKNQICIHPFITGEIALGHLKNRKTILRALQGLPNVSVATNDEVMHFIGQRNLYGKGIGFVDVHLLAAVQQAGNCSIWARDKRLSSVADSLQLAVKY